MEYTVKKLAQMAGVSPRTLRYYDEIGLLTPCRINSSGYRIYGEKEVDALQQILLFRELGLPLDAIQAILSNPGHDRLQALKAHRETLKARMAHLAVLCETVDKTIEGIQGVRCMTDKEKFEGLKEKLIADNEAKYGKEVREKYGEAAVEKSNRAFAAMGKETFDAMNALSAEILERLAQAVKAGDGPGSEEGQAIAALHRDWISKAWGSYSKEAHRGVVNLYVEDPRFTAYYDEKTPGCAVFLRDAVAILCEE